MKLSDVKIKQNREEVIETNLSLKKSKGLGDRKKITYVLIGLVLITGIVLFVYRDDDSGKQIRIEDIAGPSGSIEAQSALGEEFKVYSNDEYGFSLEVPFSIKEQVFEEEDGKVILFQKQSGGVGFQIFISPFYSDKEVITSSMIKEDIPGAIIEEPQEAILGDGIRALIFFTDSAEIGRTREVWFIKNGYLYQFTTFASQDSLLAGILSTLKFY